MKTNEPKIRQAISDVWYANPPGVSTFSPCDCGRGAARGGRMCRACAEEALAAALDDRDKAAEYCRLVRSLRECEHSMFE